MKKIFLLLAVMATLFAGAQNAVGNWQFHSAFGGDVTAVADAKNWVYYLASGNLFRLDKQTDENEALSIVNDLTDMVIKQVYYNSDKDYLVVVYTNSNIDIIESDGSVVNMPEIKDAVMTLSKAINDVTFAPGVIYLATDFGYVVVDDNKFVVKESHLYGKSLSSVAQVGKMLLLCSDEVIYYGLADEYHEQLDAFDVANKKGQRIWPISDSTFYCMTGWTFFATMNVQADGHASFKTHTLIENKATQLQNAKDGFLLYVTNLSQCYKADKEGRNLTLIESDGEICSSNPNGDGTIWAAGPLGLHDLEDATNYYLPNALTTDRPFWMSYNKATDLLYVSSPSTNYFFTDNKSTVVNTYDGMTWDDVTPDGAPVNGSFQIMFMPGEPDTYFLSTWQKGLFKVVNDEIALIYDASNSPMMKEQGAMHPITTIDRNGNVWVVQSFENPDHPVMVLPASKSKANAVTINDWITPNIEGLNSGHTKNASLISTRNSAYDIKIFNDGDYKMPIIMWNSNGEISSRPQQVMLSELIDQDGQPFSWLYIMCFTEDLNGIVWMGSTEGVISFNPAQAFSNNFRVNHIKVPRNDGTGMADYLLNGIQVNDIAVDGANRKWIATQSSGLFLVSADGTQIIKKFNTTNSPLATNTVYRVCCNPNSNSIYITTPVGLYEYFSDSSPAESNYSNIYAYPNPVRPDYTGDVTITGMMDNSLIKIADASGNVIRQLKSTGGMATWDCCNQYGERVKTGVYMVLCSRANGGSEAVVTKIAVIR
ncbi:MAG: hypothetical protein IJM58_09515 [Muribaculaceae bacterium]|nr:hypothetical protein [Muribaculaceae bacterium]